MLRRDYDLNYTINELIGMAINEIERQSINQPRPATYNLTTVMINELLRKGLEIEEIKGQIAFTSRPRYWGLRQLVRWH